MSIVYLVLQLPSRKEYLKREKHLLPTLATHFDDAGLHLFGLLYLMRGRVPPIKFYASDFSAILNYHAVESVYLLRKLS